MLYDFLFFSQSPYLAIYINYPSLLLHCPSSSLTTLALYNFIHLHSLHYTIPPSLPSLPFPSTLADIIFLYYLRSLLSFYLGPSTIPFSILSFHLSTKSLPLVFLWLLFLSFSLVYIYPDPLPTLSLLNSSPPSHTFFLTHPFSPLTSPSFLSSNLHLYLSTSSYSLPFHFSIPLLPTLQF